MEGYKETKLGLIPNNWEFKTLKNVVRGIFLTLGMIVVLYGFYGTMREVNEMRVLLQEEVEIKEKYLYPSITFCYKFNCEN